MLKRLAERWFNQLWYHKKLPALLLWPVSVLYCLVVGLRSWLYKKNLFSSEKPAVPLIVVGNLNVGGTGKTPMVLWLASFLRESGYHPGIICSGYRGQSTAQPQHVVPGSAPQAVSDEAVLLAERTGCPVVAGRDRLAAAAVLVQQYKVTLLISDDGLQHYRMQRDIEILMIDAARGLGNGFCLPAGPLREPAKRLQTVDLVVSKGNSPLTNWCMLTTCSSAYSIGKSGRAQSLETFKSTKIHAVAGLANPKSFFACLRAAGLEVMETVFGDHHGYTPGDLDFDDNLPVLMTEKDAVKCRRLQAENCWAVPLETRMHDDFGKVLISLLPEPTSMRQSDIG